MTTMAKAMPEHVRNAYDSYQEPVRATLLTCRDQLFDIAERNHEVGPVEETLKWGQPAYLTPQTRSGSTIRLAPTSTGEEAAIFVHCNTNLIDQFKAHYPDTFSYQGNRALIIPALTTGLHNQIGHCLALALTYHSRKKTG